MSKGSARALLPLACSFLLLLAVALVTAFLVAQQERDAHALAGLMQTRGRLLELLSALQDAETGQRGFLLKGETAYLAPYDLATREMKGRVRALRAAYGSDAQAPNEVDALETTVTDKLAELKRTIDLENAGDHKAALDVLGSDLGLRLMDRARSLVSALMDDNARRVSGVQRQAARIGRWVEIAVALAIIAAIGAAGYVLSDARRRERRLVATARELATVNGELRAEADRRSKIEAQLRQSQKMEAVGQLTGGLAHDFNNMMAVVIGSLTMLKRRRARGESGFGSYVDLALDGATRASNLTHRLLAFARRQPLAPEVMQLNKILPGLSELLRRTLGETIMVETVLGGGLWQTKVDANQLESAVVNLAVNARDAMPNGGKLTVETANTHLDEAYAARHLEVSAGQYVMLAVTDSGSGMPPDVVEKAFDPFFTTKDLGQGTGLGLSQVYGFVKQSGGHVKIYSEVGSGTTVRIYLPRSFDAVTAATAQPRASDVPLGDASHIILVVEDEEGVRRLTVDALRELNYTVLHARDGIEALRIFEHNEAISMVLTDVVMPQITGKQLVDRVRTKRPDLKVLFMTGYTRNAIVHNGVIDPDVQLISKPFTLEQLAVKVRSCLTAA